MRSVVKVVAIIAAAVVFSEPAAGQFRDYGTQCFEGSFRACTSLSVSWQHLANPFGGELTTLDFRFSNRQGSPGFNYSGHTALSLVTIYGYETNIVTDAWALATRARLEGNAGGFAGGASTFWDQLGRSFQLENYGGAPYPLFGCDPSPVLSEPFYAGLGGASYTCNQGWFIYSVTMPGTVSITDDTRYRLNFNNWTLPFPGGPAGSCFVGETCVTAVPEPATLALLGTGLASLALARRRRKQRG